MGHWTATGRGREHPRRVGGGREHRRRSVRRELWRPWSGRLMRMRLVYRLPASPSDREWQGAQSRQGSAEQVPPGPALREMKSETARRACKSSDQGEEASSEGSGGH